MLRVPACLRGFAGAVAFAARAELLGAREAAFLVRGDTVRALDEQKIDLLGIMSAAHAIHYVPRPRRRIGVCKCVGAVLSNKAVLDNKGA